MKAIGLLAIFFLTGFATQDTEKTVLAKLQNHTWHVLEYAAEGMQVEIEPSLRDMYWFKFHEDGTYTTMFEGDLATGTYQYIHKKSQLRLNYEPYGSDDITLEFLTDDRIELGGPVYGKDGYMILEKK